MDFSDPPRRRGDENLLPMINVVFLLLIFFLIAARLTAPEPFAVEPPEARSGAEALGEFTLFLSADGKIGYRDAEGDQALEALASARVEHCDGVDCAAVPTRLTLRADAALPAADLAALLPRLSSLGFAAIELVARPGGAE